MKRIGTVSKFSAGRTSLRAPITYAPEQIRELELLARKCTHSEDFPFGKEQREKVDALIKHAVNRSYRNRLNELPITNSMGEVASVGNSICLFRLENMTLDTEEVRKILSELAIHHSSFASVFIIARKERFSNFAAWYFGIRCRSAQTLPQMRDLVLNVLKRNTVICDSGQIIPMQDAGEILRSLTSDSVSEIGSVSGVPLSQLKGANLDSSMTSKTGDVCVLLLAESVEPQAKDNLTAQYQRLIDIVATKAEEITQTSNVQDVRSRTVEEYIEHCRTETSKVTEEVSVSVEEKKGLLDDIDFSALKNGGWKSPKNLLSLKWAGKKAGRCVRGAAVGAAVGVVAGALTAPLTVPVGACLFAVTGFSVAGMLSGSKKETKTTTGGKETGQSDAQTTGETRAATEGLNVSSGISVKWGMTNESANDAAKSLRRQKSRLDEGADVWRWGAYVFANSKADASAGVATMKEVLDTGTGCGIDRSATSVWDAYNRRRRPLATVLSMCEHPLFALSSDLSIKESNVSVLTTQELAKVMPMGSVWE